MTQRLAERLRVARSRSFVGRAQERALFEAALTAEEFPFVVLHLFGSGGVGKTTLLKSFTALCEQYDVPAYTLDGRNIEPLPESFVSALRQALQLAPTEHPLPFLEAHRRQVLLIDTYESLAPLDDWLRDVFLPQLPGETLVVLAGRNPPTTAWRSDPGWQSLLRILPLPNLTPDESMAYLNLRQIPAAQHQAALTFTHGHPLALSLVADAFSQRPDASFQPDAVPDVIKTLLAQFVQHVPGPAHRAALESCALVRVTTEALLKEMLDMPDVHELFEWLRGLSFIEVGREGLFPHDLAREALEADLRWRNPDWYAELHRRAGRYYAGRTQQAHSRHQQRILMDYIFLHRTNPVVRPFYEWSESGGVIPEPAQPADLPALRAMIARHEGDDAARIADYWFVRQPHGVLAFRDAATASPGQPIGLLLLVALHETQPEDIAIDPAAQAALRYLERTAPLRAGECATLFRFWMARDTYQSISPIQSIIFVTMVRHYLTTSSLAFTFLPCAESAFWEPLFRYADLHRIPDADFAIGERGYGVYGHDWRATPPMVWLELLGKREVAADSANAPQQRANQAHIVMGEADFHVAIREALYNYTRPTALHSNPLLQTRLITERAGAAATASERVAALQALIQTACETLNATPREAKAYGAVYHTYLQPALTQEQAAELLDLPFSTFRRHLKNGIARISELLWQWELQGAAVVRSQESEIRRPN
jgi:hypothetical protein